MTGDLGDRMHPAELDLLDTDVEESLRSSLRDLLAARCTPDRVLAVYDGDRSLTPNLWRAVARDLGLAGLLVPEDHGGAGASAREAAVVLEELGRAAAPVPFLTSAVVATAALLHDSRTEAGAALLGELASGSEPRRCWCRCPRPRGRPLRWSTRPRRPPAA